MDLETWKLVALLGLFSITLVMVFLPFALWGHIRHVQDPRRRHAYQVAVSFLSCFGGGVFLATCLLHLLPEARRQLTQGFIEKWGEVPQFPTLEFLCILGLLMVLVIEQVTLSWKESAACLVATQTAPLSPAEGSMPNYGSVQQHSPPPEEVGGWTLEEEEEDESGTQSVHGDPNSHSSLRSAMLVVSLSMHSVFEGVAIGLQPDGVSLAQVLGAVSIHKCILAFTLGLNLVHSRFRKWGVVFSGLVFAAMAPLGMGLAMLLLQRQRKGAALLEGVLQSLACGTFLYVTFFEVLPHEMNQPTNRMAKLLAVLLGVAVVTGLLLSFPPS